MKFGASTFIWVSPFTTKNVDIIYKIREMGFEAVEIALEELSLVDLKKVRKALDATGLGCVVCGTFGRDRDLISDDPSVRKNAIKYITNSIAACNELGSDTYAGPVYSAVGKTGLVSEEQKKSQWAICVEGLGEIATVAKKMGVVIAIEPLNRFETNFVNLASDAIRLVKAVDSPNIGISLDTFHMNIEEKNFATTIRDTGKLLYHFQASENDRGTPGTGHVPWGDVKTALQNVGYERNVVVESFAPGATELASAVSIWRKLEVDQDTLAIKSLTFLRKLFNQ